ncbi:RNA methyltransferase [uncultured Algimonas sp.]|uniref:TrmH family RNA methyltransferase n=1 Tax=uncultured Algimonas sp. TaxID=1547920 RepID=UPI002624AAB8|nr:RNA methyltransferase [uncultured Algimonas sp.]
MDDGPRKNENAGGTGGKSRRRPGGGHASGKRGGKGGGAPHNARQTGNSGGHPDRDSPMRSKGMIGGSARDAKKGGPRRSKGARDHGAVTTPRKPNRGNYNKRSNKGAGPNPWIWGWHAVQAVLANPRRTIHQIMVTEQAAGRLGLADGHPNLKMVAMNYIDTALPRGAAHQGVAVKAAPLEWPDLSQLADDADDDALILVLDQITDPHNVGAMLRLCSAFGVSALVMQTRKAPPLFGATAKVAVGCVETVPVCLEVNIAQSLKTLQNFGYTVVGLAGETETTLPDALSGGGRRALVMGAEGPGLRELVAKNCDVLARIPMQSHAVAGQAESLNVATAAGIALYEARR